MSVANPTRRGDRRLDGVHVKQVSSLGTRLLVVLAMIATTVVVTATAAAAAPPPFTVSGPAPVAEGDPGAAGEAVFTLTYDGTLLPGESYDVDYNTFTEPGDSAAAGSDYVETVGTATFTALETSIEVTVPLVADDAIEPAESFSLYTQGETGDPLIAKATIHDDDGATIVGGDRDVSEGPDLDLTIRYLGQDLAADDATFHVIAIPGSATNPEDYGDVSPSSTVTFTTPSNGDEEVVSIPIEDEGAPEPAETFTVELRSQPGSAVPLASIEVTILANGNVPTVWIEDPDPEDEDDPGTPPIPPPATKDVTVTVRRSAPTPVDTTVRVSTQVATTGGEPATSDVDYVSFVDKLVTIPAGDETATFTVQFKRDTIDELHEIFQLVPSAPTNAVLRTSPSPNATVTILDNDDPPSLSVASDGPVTEPDAGNATTQSFTVTLSAASGKTVTVDHTTVDGTAKAGADFTSTTGRLVFTPGQTTKKVNVTVRGDDLYEVDETYKLGLVNPQATDASQPPMNATIATAEATATIRDNETITISIADVTVDEHDGTAEFDVTLNRSSETEVRVKYSTASGTGPSGATSGSDFTGKTDVDIVFPAGTTAKTASVPITDDLDDELSPERFSVTLSSPSSAATGRAPALGRATATGSIIDNDETLSIDDVTVDEDAGTARFTVSLTAPVAADITVRATTSDQSAGSPGDYTAKAADVVIEAGKTSASFVVTVLDDSFRESDETFRITLSAVRPTEPSTGVGVSIADGIGVGTIRDDDAIGVSIADRRADEGTSPGNTSFQFTVILDRTHSDTISIPWSTRAGSAAIAEDFVASAGTLVFTPTQTEKVITVPVVADSAAEPDETFFVDLDPPADVTELRGTATGTIVNDDGAPPTLSIADVSQVEGNSGTTLMTLKVTQSARSLVSTSVGYATSDDAGEAVASVDYTAKTGRVTIPAGSLEATFTVDLAGETIFEDDETFTVTLSEPVNAQLGDAVGTATITNDDALPKLTIGDDDVVEGNSGTTKLSFPLALSNPSENPITVTATSANGTATAGSDYTAVARSVEIPALATAGLVEVTVAGENVFEGDETLTVTLSSPSGAILGETKVGNGIITNDDAMPTISIDDASTSEGDSGTKALNATLRLSNPSQADVSVLVTSSNGSATAGSDYVALSTRRTIPGMSTVGSVSVTVNGDTTIEPDETLFLTLTDPSGATLGDDVGEATIVNDDFEVRSANERYAEWLVVHFLGRSVGPDDPLVDLYTRRLDAGASRSSVVRDLAYSDVYLGAFVESLYRSTLGRGSDPNGKRNWIEVLRSGVAPADVASMFYASDEYFRRAGNANRPWVQDLYREILNREADERGLQNWVAQLEAGVSRTKVASGFYYSIESRRKRVIGLYQFLLLRNPDPTGMQTWTEVLKNGRDVDLAVTLATSAEYYNKAQQRDARNANLPSNG